MSAFTDEQINEIIGIFTQHMGTRQYIGARYVPIFGRKDETSIIWDNTKPYEPLTVVLYQGNSYTSRQYVPSGIDILNTEFWANTGNYNAQIEQYRQEVIAYDNRITANSNNINTINNIIPSADFSENNTVKDYVDNVKDIIGGDFTTTNTVASAIAANAENIAINASDIDDIELELQTIAQDKIIVFDTVSEMKQYDSFANGSTCKTLGFYTLNDGGGGFYYITDTGIANEMDVIACGSYYANLVITDSPVNVLQLGCKNDNTNDVSTIVNTMTLKYPLYFPIGVYHTDATLIPYYQFIGARNTSNAVTIDGSEDCAIIYSNTESECIHIYSRNGISVKNLGIYVHDNETAILIDGGTRHIVENILIRNLGGTGIAVMPATGTTRIVIIKNATILGKDGCPNSTGIFFNNNGYDSLLTNIHIMKVQKGIVTSCQLYGDNFHLWGGITDHSLPAPTTEWINGSAGITINNTNCIFNNAYIDTFKNMFTTTGEFFTVSVDNFICMNDGSVDFNENSLVTNINDGATIRLNGGYIRLGNDLIGTVGIGARSSVEMMNVIVDSSERNIFNNTNYIQYPRAYNMYHVFPREASGYLFVCAVNVRYNDDVTINIHNYENVTTLHFTVVGNSVSNATKTGYTAAEYGYVYNTTTKTIIIYKHVTSALTSLQPNSITCENSICYLVDSNLLTQRTKNYYFANSTSMPSGYSQFS